MDKLFQSTEYIFSKVNFNRTIPDSWSEVEKIEDFEYFCERNKFVELDGVVYEFKKSREILLSEKQPSRIVLKNGRHIVNSVNI